MAYLSRLSLANFRCFTDLELELPPGVVVFFGANAQGKTTLLEAVYLLAIARCFRAENEREVINFDAGVKGEQALVGGTIEKEARRLSVYVGFQSVGYQPAASGASSPGVAPATLPVRGSDSLGYSVRKQIRVNRVRRTSAELVGTVGAVLFSADDIDLVYGPPSGRRRFLDILISQSDPMYIKGLQRYQRIVQQRNQLLRTLRDGRAGAEELDFWNGELVKEGSAITWQRQQTMRRLSLLCLEHQQQLSGSDDEFQVDYRPSVPAGDAIETTAGQFEEALAVFRRRELATATTAVGPHRDDFRLLGRGLDLSTFASRGEARTLALTLRLAEASYLAVMLGEEPLVLLDDVLSEMDGDRRRRVLDKVGHYPQSLITTTDVELVRGYFGSDATYFQVADGRVVRC